MDLKFTYPFKMTRIFTTLVLFLANISLSITIVLLNKTIYTYYGYPNLTMTCVHLAFTALGLAVSERVGIFKAKHGPIKDTVLISLAFCAFVMLNNLSLQYNTVGTCTTIKCLCLPTIVIIQTTFYKRSFPWKIKLSLIPIVIGAVLNSNFDLKFSLTGVTFGLAGVAATSLYQVWIGEKQKELDMDAMQLLHHQAPMSVVSMALLALCVDTFAVSNDHEPLSMEGMGLVLCSGMIAFGLNISIYLIIGTTSPLTYNIVGNSKMILTLMGGYILFSEPIQPNQCLGIIFTFSGALLYSAFSSARENRHCNYEKTAT